jgi:1,4-alpha-glucan branching enzyme
MVKTVRSKAVELKLNAPTAKKVSLTGSFDNWDIDAHPAKKDAKGNWTVKMSLKPGQYEYKFVVDGSWVIDPLCKNVVANAFGSKNCVVEVK